LAHLRLRGVCARPRFVDGRAERACSRGREQTGQDRQRNDEQLKPIDRAYQRIATACSEKPPTCDSCHAALHDFF